MSHYGFNAVCKEKQYDWVCYMVTFWSVYNLWNHFCYIRNSAVRRSKYTIRSVSVIGVMVETIVIMAAYSLVIVKKYEEK